MLPKTIELEFETVTEDIPQTGKSFLFDFEKGDFVLKDGKLVSVEGLEALKVWIEKTLRTERFKFEVYEGTEYGSRIQDLIGSVYPLDFIKIELEREITEALIIHPEIEQLIGWIFTLNNGLLTVKFEVISTIGSVEVEYAI